MAALSAFLVIDDDVARQLVTAQEGVPLSAEQAEVFLALRRLAMVFYAAIFFSLAGKLAETVPGALDEVPSMADVYAMIASGAVSMRTREGQALLGAAMLKRAIPG
jgi:hypothetical protein